RTALTQTSLKSIDYLCLSDNNASIPKKRIKLLHILVKFMLNIELQTSSNKWKVATHAFPASVKNWGAFFISHRPPLTQTGMSFMVRSQSEYQISIILGAVQIHRRLLREERPR